MAVHGITTGFETPQELQEFNAAWATLAIFAAAPTRSPFASRTRKAWSRFSTWAVMTGRLGGK
jgi:hypothetical protein